MVKIRHYSILKKDTITDPDPVTGHLYSIYEHVRAPLGEEHLHPPTWFKWHIEVWPE